MSFRAIIHNPKNGAKEVPSIWVDEYSAAEKIGLEGLPLYGGTHYTIEDSEDKPLKLVALRRERTGWSATDYFVADSSIENVEATLREAIAEFVKTDDGKKMVDYAGGDFNWGDAVSSSIDSVLKKYGIERKDDRKSYTISGEVVEIFVNQDEVLCSEIEEEDEEE